MKTQNIKYILLLIIITLIGSFFFFQSDKSYLQKKTVKLLELASSPFISRSQTAIFRRIQGIAKYMHFSVEYEVNLGNEGLYKNRSLAELRPSMLVYFKKNHEWKINIPSKEDLNIIISMSEEKKTAEVSFSIQVFKENKKINCNALLHWIKEEKWLIHKMRVFSCQNESSLEKE